MIKYLITSECNRKCEYCITKNIHQKECEDCEKIIDVLMQFRNEHIMITGGEPTLSENFGFITMSAKMINKHIYLTSQNPEVLKRDSINMYYDAVTFSLHDYKNVPKVEIDIPVYASILSDKFFQDLPRVLRQLGYAGLTINEEQREGCYFNDSIVQEFPGFSLKINRKGNCMDDTMILPDLTVINDFTPYL